MSPAKCNYEIYDKKLLAIIWCFEKWKPKLKDTGMLVKVLTDHKGLKYFMTTNNLTSRQARWAEFLSEYNFVISYQSDKKNDKADTFTRKSNKRPMDDNNKKLEHWMQTLLLAERFEHAANLQSIKVKDKNLLTAGTSNGNITSGAEPHIEPQILITSAEHRPGVSKLLILLEKVKDTNWAENQFT